MRTDLPGAAVHVWSLFDTASRILDGTKLQRLYHVAEFLEASPGIEPGYKDLQSSASPLRHEASLHRLFH